MAPLLHLVVVAVTPDRTLEQRIVALKRANEIRVDRAALKRRMTRAIATQTILDPPAYAHNMKVYDLLLSVPKIGAAKARRLLHFHRISSQKTLGGLSERQRHALAELNAE